MIWKVIFRGMGYEVFVGGLWDGLSFYGVGVVVCLSYFFVVIFRFGSSRYNFVLKFIFRYMFWRKFYVMLFEVFIFFFFFICGFFCWMGIVIFCCFLIFSECDMIISGLK